VAEQGAPVVFQSVAALSTSMAGHVVYRGGSREGQNQFIWFDRSGKELATLGPDGDFMNSPMMSPDGRFVALTRAINGNADVWLLETARGVLRRFTSDIVNDIQPVWSPDGSRIVFGSNRKGEFDLYEKSATGTESERLLLGKPGSEVATDWSPDGRFLLYRINDPKTRYDIWAMTMDGTTKTFPVVETSFDERDGQFSPDGKWIAYQSNESGQFEIYVQEFPGPAERTPVSTTGGAQVRWRRDGKELFYIALDGRLMAVPLELAAGSRTVDVGTPVPLFTTRVGGAFSNPLNRQQYMVSDDGQRFLMNTVSAENTPPMTLILNWKPKPS
jgi:Tol biopolymer transport system component